LARGNAADIDAAVQAARKAFDGPWGAASAAERGRLLYRLSMLVAARHEELAQLEARDTGKPLRQARADAAALARYFEFYAGAADKLHGETLPYQTGYTVFTVREPHGVTGHIVPWNYPMQIFGRSVGAALAAGNACVVKPAEDACLSMLRVAELAAEAGLPEGALNIVTGYGYEAGAALARHPGIDHISFTGSPQTGKAVTQMAAENHVPVTLELGGKSPQIVFADADLDAAVPVLVRDRAERRADLFGGQPRADRAHHLRAVARPARHGVQCVARRAVACSIWTAGRSSARSNSNAYGIFSDAQHDGIAMAAHGEVIHEAPETGFYQAPTLLRDVPPDHRLAREEVFGPVLAAMPFADEDEARAQANGTDYGLVAGIWTRDGARQLRLRGACARARCSSTTMARAAASNCRSAASSIRDTAAKKGSRRCTALRC
jgi:aldehyde dehydrogenase (NAD+)